MRRPTEGVCLFVFTLLKCIILLPLFHFPLLQKNHRYINLTYIPWYTDIIPPFTSHPWTNPCHKSMSCDRTERTSQTDEPRTQTPWTLNLHGRKVHPWQSSGQYRSGKTTSSSRAHSDRNGKTKKYRELWEIGSVLPICDLMVSCII